jgi:hypothetical protein
MHACRLEATDHAGLRYAICAIATEIAKCDAGLVRLRDINFAQALERLRQKKASLERERLNVAQRLMQSSSTCHSLLYECTSVMPCACTCKLSWTCARVSTLRVFRVIKPFTVQITKPCCSSDNPALFKHKADCEGRSIRNDHGFPRF